MLDLERLAVEYPPGVQRVRLSLELCADSDDLNGGLRAGVAGLNNEDRLQTVVALPPAAGFDPGPLQPPPHDLPTQRNDAGGGTDPRGGDGGERVPMSGPAGVSPWVWTGFARVGISRGGPATPFTCSAEYS